MSIEGQIASSRNRLGVGVEVAVAIVGGLLLAGAIAAEQQWWDRHFLPIFFLSHHKYVLGERLARLATGLAGMVLILFVRPMMGRMAKRMSAREIIASIARVILAI
jgi:hypothetical protein